VARRIRKKSLVELNFASLTNFILTPEDKKDFCLGIQLFNKEKFWEAHESWEKVWLRHPEDGRIFLQGLIQLAAAYHQFQKKIHRGFVAHLRHAQERLVLFPKNFLSIDVDLLRKSITQSLDRIVYEDSLTSTNYASITPVKINVSSGKRFPNSKDS